MNRSPQIETRIFPEVIDIIDALVVVLEKDGAILLFNEAAESATGYSFGEVQGKTPWELFLLAEEKDEVREVFSQLTAGDFPNHYTNYWQTRDGGKLLIEWSNTAIEGAAGEVEFVIATGIDITKRSDAEKRVERYIDELENRVAERTAELTVMNEKLEALTRVDSLTGVFNRRHFDSVLKKEVERGKRSNKPLTLLLCDIDFFKNYNDTHGHVAGDRCLVTVASVIDDFFKRAADFVARYGGEEFVVILPEVDSKEALEIASGLISEVQSRCLPHGSSSIDEMVTISVGIATMDADKLIDSTSIVEAADKVLYQAKAEGRNTVRQH